MTPTVITIKTLVMTLEYFNLSVFPNNKKENKIIIGYRAGYILKASTNSPLNSNKADRCNPQPGQSTPNICFVKQGSKYFSILIK